MKPSQDRKKTQAAYDSLSRFYDVLSGPAENHARLQAVDLLNIEGGDILLEVGCGTGMASLEMGRRTGLAGYVYSLDLSTSMLRVAQKKVQSTELRPNIDLINGDAFFLPLLSRSIMGILMSFTLELFSDEDIPLVLSELKRVINLDGRLCILSMSKWQSKGRLLKIYERLHEQFPAWVDCRPILLEQTLAENGFEIIEARQDSLFGLPIEIVKAVINR